MKIRDIQYESFRAGDVPCLVARSDSPADARGTVVVFHGLYSCKEDCHDMITAIAREGINAIAVDSVGHGERQKIDPRKHIIEGSREFTERAMAFVLETAGEFPSIVARLEAAGYPVSGGVGIAGVSMGGVILYELLVREHSVRAAVALISSPAFSPDRPESPHHFPEKVPPTALLTITAGRDIVVPPEAARNYHERLGPLYSAVPDRLHEIRYPDSGHLMRPEDWVAARRATAEWFDCHFR